MQNLSIELKWIKKRYYYDNINEKRLKNIFYFTLIWNIFENECCNRDAKISTHPKEIAQNINGVSEQKINKIFDYFKNRYITNGTINEIFKSFSFDKNNTCNTYKKFVKEKLKAQEVTLKEQIQALLYIAFRLRNNLYHGVKDVKKLYEQNENFRQINIFLMEVNDNYSKKKGQLKCRHLLD